MLEAALLAAAVLCSYAWWALVRHLRETNPDGAFICGFISAFPFWGTSIVSATSAWSILQHKRQGGGEMIQVHEVLLVAAICLLVFLWARSKRKGLQEARFRFPSDPWWPRGAQLLGLWLLQWGSIAFIPFLLFSAAVVRRLIERGQL